MYAKIRIIISTIGNTIKIDPHWKREYNKITDKHKKQEVQARNQQCEGRSNNDACVTKASTEETLSISVCASTIVCHSEMIHHL